MKNLRFLCAMLLLLVSSVAYGDIGVVESTGEFVVNGSTPIYLSPIPGGTGNPSLDGYDFGTFDPCAGDTLLMTNWFLENYAFDNSGGGGTNNWIDPAVNTATLNATIAGAASSTNFTHNGQSGNNHFWASNTTIDLLAGLGNGTYTFTVGVDYEYNEFDGNNTNELTSTGNSVATATFTINKAVPEPGSAGLILLASLTVFGRRRRS